MTANEQRADLFRCDDAEVVTRAAAVVAGYSKAPAGTEAEVTVLWKGNQQTVRVIPAPPAQNRPLLI